MNKTKVGIIGTGNIGTDLLLKLNKSKYLECSIFIGRNPESKGIKIAESMGIKTSFESIKVIEDNPECCDIVFDATSAGAHKIHAPILKKLGKFTIDLTPAKIGKMCVPYINLNECLNEYNVNLITCGGQATLPIAYTISKLYPDTEYIEIVASIASKSAGVGTRNNIDEFTQTTKDALKQFTKVKKTKAIITLNSAEPPMTMRNTVYALIENVNMDVIKSEIYKTAECVKKYVPNYKIVAGPIFENGKLAVTIEVNGAGDYLPKYAGNLDIITCAAIEVAEKYVQKKEEGTINE